MKHKHNHILFLFVLCIWLVVSSCNQPGGENPGSEFMPDMAHSIAYEANHYTYYYNNTWGSEDEYYEMAQPREPVKGTVARGYAGIANPNGSNDKVIRQSMNGSLTNSSKSIPLNGSVPYDYEDTEEDRARAATDMVNNPFPISDSEMNDAKVLYNTFCGICHGDKGDGAGYLVREDGGKYPAQPANLLLDQYVDMSNGQYYHAIMYGKNLMGAYSEKISFEERWQVIHYIRSLQAKEKKLKYNEEENTLNDWATPLSKVTADSELISSNLNGYGEAHTNMGSDEHHEGEHHGDHTDGHHEGDNHGENHDNESHEDHGSDHNDHH